MSDGTCVPNKRLQATAAVAGLKSARPRLSRSRWADGSSMLRIGYELLTRHPTELRPLIIQGWKPFARFKGHLVKRALHLDVKSQVASAGNA